ncbi:MAG: ATP-binding protein [Myxococcota bacterium]|nr:ATP-binding protein [Myxococcota bacterium]
MSQEATLPIWAEELKLRYLSGEASMFLLHGNVRDVYPWRAADGTTHYVPLRRFLEEFFGRSKDIVGYYNVSEGLQFPDKKTTARFRAVVNARRTLQGKAPVASLPTSISGVLPIVEDMITNVTQSSAMIIDYTETIVPMGDLSYMSEADKVNLVSMQRWSSDPGLLHSDNLVVLITENLADVHRRVVASTQLAAVSVPLPTDAERLGFIEASDLSGIEMEMEAEALAKVTAGLTLVQIRGLFRRARQSGECITFRAVSRRKKSIIEQECHGLVEFVDPSHDFSHVGGMQRLKDDLMRVAAAIKSGRTNQVPMGIIFVGPMGTGKTFLAEAFAAESGLTCLKFKNFREKWVGSTEGNLEKILQVVDGLGYVLLIIDEADRSMSSGSEGDGGTSSRVIARIKEFMSDTSHRGRVVILMLTNRPDKLDTDLKRPGRFDLKIPFFHPEDNTEREAILNALTRKNKLDMEEAIDMELIAEATEGHSGAELESVLLGAAGVAAAADRDVISQADLEQAVIDVIPSRDTRMLEFMEMLAVFESSSRRMLPARYKEIPTDEVHTRLDQLRAALGRRVL